MITCHGCRIFVRLLREWTVHEDISKSWGWICLWMALGWMFHLKTNSYSIDWGSVGCALPAVRWLLMLATVAALGSRCGGFSTGLVGSGTAVLLILAPGYDLIFVAYRRSRGIVSSCGFCAPWLALYLLPLQLLSSVQAPLAVPYPASYQLCS